jgi:hypothetical protein
MWVVSGGCGVLTSEFGVLTTRGEVSNLVVIPRSEATGNLLLAEAGRKQVPPLASLEIGMTGFRELMRRLCAGLAFSSSARS